MSKVIGIDLGTTNSIVSIMEGGVPTIINNQEGSNLTPSVVHFSNNGEILVGQLAKRKAVSNPKRTVSSIKRHMGTLHRVVIERKKYSPEEISAMILRKLKNDAEKYLGETVHQAVITVPAYFSDSQRQATKDAGKIAGLDVLRIISEPTAAALAYGVDKTDDQTILVYDFGGGTFDVSILEISDGVFEVKTTSGDTNLGGYDIDQRIVEWLISRFKAQEGKDLSNDVMARERLQEAAEKAKIELSGMMTTNINLPFIFVDADGPKHLDVDLTRAEFEEMILDLIVRTIMCTKQALIDADITKDDIEKVILVGGSTRIPAVQEAIKKFIGREPHHNVNPYECVAIGAAIQAGLLSGEIKDVLFLDVTPLSLGIETLGGVFSKVIERNTTIPTSKKQVFSTAVDNQASVEIHVLQGEREMAAENKTLGKFELGGIPKAPRGVPKIEVTFDINHDGIVSVSAKELTTGKEQKITITATGTLSKREISRMLREAKANENADRKRKECAEIRNKADSLCYQAEKVIKDMNGNGEDELISKLKLAIDTLKHSLQGEDLEKIKEFSEAVTEPLYELSEMLYSKTNTEEDAYVQDAMENSDDGNQICDSFESNEGYENVNMNNESLVDKEDEISSQYGKDGETNMTIFCFNCGKQLSKEAKFCAYCGTDLSPLRAQFDNSQNDIENCQSESCEKIDNIETAKVDFNVITPKTSEEAFWLAERFEIGIDGCEQNLRKAFDLYLMAARSGNLEAEFRLGRAYENGELNLKVNEEKAYEWYLEAAENGHIKSMLILAEAFEYGYLDLEEDEDEAFEWYLKAAECGNVNAQFVVAEAYELENLGVDEDKEEAIEWYLKAAENGHVESMYKVAEMYYELSREIADENYDDDDEEFEVSDEEQECLDIAEKWYLEAAKNGHKQAARMLEDYF